MFFFLLLLPTASFGLAQSWLPTWLREDDAFSFSRGAPAVNDLDCAVFCFLALSCSGFTRSGTNCRLLFLKPTTSAEIVSAGVQQAWLRVDLVTGACGFELERGGSRYRLIERAYNHSQAITACAAGGGWLAVLRDRAELSFAAGLARNRSLLIGATWRSGEWRWGPGGNSSVPDWLWRTGVAPSPGPAAILEDGSLHRASDSDLYASLCECPQLRHFYSAAEAIAGGV